MDRIKQNSTLNNALIIGAGLSGLACAEALARRNIPVTILEARDRVAVPWRERHPALRLNIHRHFVSLPGMPAPDGDGTFLRRDTVVDYLERYARSIDVPIRCGTEVRSVNRDETGWTVRTSAGEYRARHLVFATGRDRLPWIPDWPGRESFAGRIVHAADFGEPSSYDGKRVLVVGAGNSGVDVLNHLARHRPAEMVVSVRHGPAVVPARVFGFPLHRLARLFAAMPTFLLDPAFRLTERLFLGNLARHGLPSHPDGGGTRLLRDGVAFAIDDGFVAALKAGRARVVPEVTGFAGKHVVCGDGESCAADVVIAATGYRTGLEPLVGALDVLDPHGRPKHPMGEEDPANPGLWFTGYRAVFTGYFDAARVAAERIGNAIASDFPDVNRAKASRSAIMSAADPAREAMP